MSKNPSFIDLFCGAGGFTLGLRQAGWKPLLGVDAWADAVQTYRRNFCDHPVFHGDIKSLSEKLLGEILPESPEWVVGGPPCQGFSTIGQRKREDPRNQLVHEFVRIVSILQPKGFVVENVVGLRDMDFVDSVSALFCKIGYSVSAMILRSADYGVPQLRHRIFFVGDRDGRSFMRPEPTHEPSNYVTVWDAIGDLPELAPGENALFYNRSPFTEFQQEMRAGSTLLQGHVASAHPQHLVQAISHIPDGGNRQSIPSHLRPKGGFHNSYSRLHSKSPAVAVTQNMGKPSGTRCIHPFQHRGLTTREGARLQGFPDRFHFEAGMTSQRLQVANAVSPILAEALGRALANNVNWRQFNVIKRTA
jgi:DNA (cytosine-5)-methyltransferase 1